MADDNKRTPPTRNASATADPVAARASGSVPRSRREVDDRHPVVGEAVPDWPARALIAWPDGRQAGAVGRYAEPGRFGRDRWNHDWGLPGFGGHDGAGVGACRGRMK